MKSGNLFAAIPANIGDEWFEDLLKTGSLRIERIVSLKPSLPEGQWYDQDHDEWVLLLQGHACLVFENDEEEIFMESGDYLHLPAHLKHRVVWTDPDQETVWLAVHF